MNFSKAARLSRCASVSSWFQSLCDSRRWSVGNCAIVGHGPVARQHAGAQELRAVGRGRELEVAIQVARRDAFVECVDEGIDLQARDATFHFHARHEPQGHRRDDAKQSVPADHVAKQLGLFRAAAAHDVAGGRDDFETFDVRDEWLGA